MRIMLAIHDETFSNALKSKNTLLLENIILRDAHNQKNKDLREQFTILKKCRRKFECLVYEMLFIRQERKPELNTRSDSIKAKLYRT